MTIFGLSIGDFIAISFAIVVCLIIVPPCLIYGYYESKEIWKEKMEAESDK